MFLLRRVGAVGAATGLVLAAGMSGAWAADTIVDSEGFAHSPAVCTGGTFVGGTQTTFTRAQFVATLDGDNDVNVGDVVGVGLGRLLGETETLVNRLGLQLGARSETVTVGTIPEIREAGVRILGSADFVVPTAAVGTVLNAQAASRYLEVSTGLVADCTTPADVGIVGLYVNRPPELEDDSASTPSETAVTTDVLVNDDATNDTGTITSNIPTADELATQDVDPVGLQSQVAIETAPAHGTASVESDGRIKYTSNAGFSGVDTVEYSLTDIDGATSTAKLSITVAEKVDVPVDEPDDEDVPPADDDEGDSDDEVVDVVEPVGNIDQTLPNGGGPASSLLWLGAGLAGAGSVAVAAGRGRRLHKHQT